MQTRADRTVLVFQVTDLERPIAHMGTADLVELAELERLAHRPPAPEVLGALRAMVERRFAAE